VPNLIEIYSVVLKMCVQIDACIICVFCEQWKNYVVKLGGPVFFFIVFIYLLLNNAVSW